MMVFCFIHLSSVCVDYHSCVCAIVTKLHCHSTELSVCAFVMSAPQQNFTSRLCSLSLSIVLLHTEFTSEYQCLTLCVAHESQALHNRTLNSAQGSVPSELPTSGARQVFKQFNYSIVSLGFYIFTSNFIITYQPISIYIYNIK